MADKPRVARTNSARGRKPANKSTGTGKKPLPEPIHVGHFIVILVMKICKKILLIDTSAKIGVYLVGVMIGSVLSDVFAFPKSYFSDKRNFLNRVFVSFGFGWTLMMLLSFVFLTSFVYTCGNWKIVVRKHILRLVFSTFWWFTLTKSFYYIDSTVGACSLRSLNDKEACLKAGKAWLGFDISGHVFLLIHNLLTISEEVKVFKYWSSIDNLLESEDLAYRKQLSEKEISQAKVSYKSLTPFIKLNIVLLTIWMVFCEFMLITSTIYRFHTVTQKIAAAFVAVGCWFISYRMIYESDVSLFPTSPGNSALNIMKPTKQR